MRKAIAIIGICFWVSTLALPFVAHGLDYTITTSLPGSKTLVSGQSLGPEYTIVTYARDLYLAALGIGGALAFIMIVYHGVRYTVSMGNASIKTDAVQGITDAILGLVLLLASYYVLQFINPNLVKLGAINDALTGAVPNLNINRSGGNITPGQKVGSSTLPAINAPSGPYDPARPPQI